MLIDAVMLSQNLMELRGSTKKFGEFDHNKIITETPGFHLLLRSSPVGSWLFG
jgi:hypothetical protein